MARRAHWVTYARRRVASRSSTRLSGLAAKRWLSRRVPWIFDVSAHRTFELHVATVLAAPETVAFSDQEITDKDCRQNRRQPSFNPLW